MPQILGSPVKQVLMVNADGAERSVNEDDVPSWEANNWTVVPPALPTAIIMNKPEGTEQVNESDIPSKLAAGYTLTEETYAMLNPEGEVEEIDAGDVPEKIAEGYAFKSAPRVLAVTVMSELTIKVRFSEAVETEAATAGGNYALSGTGKGTLNTNPESVEAVEGEANAYLLTWTEGEMVIGGDVTITVSSQVTDLLGNEIDPRANSGTDEEAGAGTQPQLVQAVYSASNTITVEFDEDMDETAALDTDNYTISGAGQGSLASHPDGADWLDPGDYTTVELTWSTGSPSTGEDVLVSVANVTDEAGNVIDPDHDEATASIPE